MVNDKIDVLKKIYLLFGQSGWLWADVDFIPDSTLKHYIGIDDSGWKHLTDKFVEDLENGII